MKTHKLGHLISSLTLNVIVINLRKLEIQENFQLTRTQADFLRRFRMP